MLNKVRELLRNLLKFSDRLDRLEKKQCDIEDRLDQLESFFDENENYQVVYDFLGKLEEEEAQISAFPKIKSTNKDDLN